MSLEIKDTVYFGTATPGSTGGVGGASMEWVVELPETGKKNVLYLVYTGNTREGYSIYQQFVWDDTNSDWVALGAFDTTIVQQGLVYEQSFDSSTNTWTVRVNQ